MMNEQADVLADYADPNIAGAFDADGRTTPAATRLEGLLALEHAIASDPARAAFARSCAARSGAGSPSSAGASAGRCRARRHSVIAAWRIRTATALDASDVADDEGSEARSGRRIRIDYVEDALSAVIRYAAMCGDRGGPRAGSGFDRRRALTHARAASARCGLGARPQRAAGSVPRSSVTSR